MGIEKKFKFRWVEILGSSGMAMIGSIRRPIYDSVRYL